MSDASDLSFDKADYGTGGPSCAVCQKPIEGPHYLLDVRKVCVSCRDAIVAHLGQPIGMSGHLRAVLAGVGAGAGSAVVWAVVRETTGYELGILAIGVGWAVAAAMRWGSGRGSRPLQVLALVIAYVSVTASYIPTFAGTSGILWFVIVAIALHGAWRGLTPPRVDLVGPVGA